VITRRRPEASGTAEWVFRLPEYLVERWAADFRRMVAAVWSLVGCCAQSLATAGVQGLAARLPVPGACGDLPDPANYPERPVAPRLPP
jgi:hypothetical protein